MSRNVVPERKSDEIQTLIQDKNSKKQTKTQVGKNDD